jgi:arylsulfatase A-like enzyme
MRDRLHRLLALKLIIPLLGPLLVIGIGIVSCNSNQQEPPRRPDILFVILDTLRADQVSSYGYHRPTTPQLDAVAAAGVLFEDVTAPAPWTWPSHASIFTGEPPWIHGAHGAPYHESERQAGDANPVAYGGIQVTQMREELPTLAERLEAGGYYSAAIATNNWLDEKLGLTRGFSRVQIFDRDAGVIGAAREQIDQSPDRPLFLFVNLLSAHLPYRDGPGVWSIDDPAFFVPSTSPDWARPYLRIEKRPFGIDLNSLGTGGEKVGIERYLAGDLAIPERGFKTLRGLYDASVRAADFSFGQILEAWTARFPKGIVIVASDHGEAFGEHRLIEHRHGVYPEELRVPLVFAAPRRIAAGQRIAAPAKLESIYATILDLAGIEQTAESLLRFVTEIDAVGAKQASSAETQQPIHAAVWPNQGLSERVGGRFSKLWFQFREASDAVILSDSGDVEFYDLELDPRMRRNLGTESLTPARAELLQRAQSRFESVRASTSSETRIELDQQMRQQLQSLGYGN